MSLSDRFGMQTTLKSSGARRPPGDLHGPRAHRAVAAITNSTLMFSRYQEVHDTPLRVLVAERGLDRARCRPRRDVCGRTPGSAQRSAVPVGGDDEAPGSRRRETRSTPAYAVWLVRLRYEAFGSRRFSPGQAPPQVTIPARVLAGVERKREGAARTAPGWKLGVRRGAARDGHRRGCFVQPDPVVCRHVVLGGAQGFVEHTGQVRLVRPARESRSTGVGAKRAVHIMFHSRV